MIMCLVILVLFHHSTGVARTEMPLSSVTLGETATFDNTVTNPMACIQVNSTMDGLKEGVLLNMLRIFSSDSGVCLGRDQSLLIEEANGGEGSCSVW